MDLVVVECMFVKKIRLQSSTDIACTVNIYMDLPVVGYYGGFTYKHPIIILQTHN